MSKQKLEAVGNEPKKYSYEELEGICNKLLEQNKYLAQKLQSGDNSMAIKKIEFLFKVLDYRSFFGAKDICTCTQEILESLGLAETGEPTDNAEQ